MENKIYYHNLGNECILAHSKGRCTFIIDCGNGATIVSINSTNYYVTGAELPDIFRIYYEESTGKFYLYKGANYSNYKYINIETIQEDNTSSGMIQDYIENPDVSEMVKLTKTISTSTVPIQYIENSSEANTTTEFVSKLPRTQYAMQSSLVMLTIRNSNGNGGSALLFLHRANTNTISNFTITEVHKDSDLNNFNITATDKGFTFSNSTKYNYKITEILNYFN